MGRPISGAGLFVAGIAGAVLVGVAGCAGGPGHEKENRMAAQIEPASCGSMTNVYMCEGILTGGQPTPADLKAAKEMGVASVLSFRKEGEAVGFDEAAEVRRLGMTFISLPWHGEAELSDAVFDEGRSILGKAQRPILVHCATANRVAAIWLAYRTLDEGTSFDQALDEAKRIGLKTTGFEVKARDYVARHTK